MTERRLKRARQLSSDNEDSEGNDDWQPDSSAESPAPSSMPRGRRGVAVPASSNRSIRLNVKAPPSRLREVTNSRQTLGRSSKRNAIVERSDSEEDDDEENEDDEDVAGDPEDDGLEDQDAEGDPEEDEDDDMNDDDEDESVVVPRAKVAALPASRKPAPEQRLQQRNVKSVEEQEMEDGSSDDLSSEPLEEEEEEEEEEEDEEEEEEGNEQDAEGDEDEEMMDEDENNDTINSTALGEEDLDSDLDSLDDGGTPDPSKLTRRQRGNADSELMALSNEAQKKKFFTAEQLSLRRAEMARRRKDLSEKRTQNEKDETLRRLLHKPAPKRRSRAQVKADLEREEFGGTPAAEGDEPKPSKIFYRMTTSAAGSVIGVPKEWQDSPAGRYFDQAYKQDQSAKSKSRFPVMVEVIGES